MTDRGVSTALNYVLALAIITVLLAGIFTAGSSVVNDQREQVIRSELRVLGNRMAADLTTMDRLALNDDNATIRLAEPLPSSVAGRSYRINVSQPSGSDEVELLLSTENPQVSVTVRLRNQTAIAETVVGGGDLVFRYAGNSVVIDRA